MYYHSKIGIMMTAHIVTLVVLVVAYRYPDALFHTAVVLDCIIVYACTTK